MLFTKRVVLHRQDMIKLSRASSKDVPKQLPEPSSFLTITAWTHHLVEVDFKFAKSWTGAETHRPYAFLLCVCHCMSGRTPAKGITACSAQFFLYTVACFAFGIASITRLYYSIFPWGQSCFLRCYICDNVFAWACNNHGSYPRSTQHRWLGCKSGEL